jgi:hypothetical protein
LTRSEAANEPEKGILALMKPVGTGAPKTENKSQVGT